MEVPKFDSIQTTEEINSDQTGKQLTFKQYVGSLTVIAQGIDKSTILQTTRQHCSSRNVYLYDIDGIEDIYLDTKEILNDYNDSNS